MSVANVVNLNLPLRARMGTLGGGLAGLPMTSPLFGPLDPSTPFSSGANQTPVNFGAATPAAGFGAGGMGGMGGGLNYPMFEPDRITEMAQMQRDRAQQVIGMRKEQMNAQYQAQTQMIDQQLDHEIALRSAEIEQKRAQAQTQLNIASTQQLTLLAQEEQKQLFEVEQRTHALSRQASESEFQRQQAELAHSTYASVAGSYVPPMGSFVPPMGSFTPTSPLQSPAFPGAYGSFVPGGYGTPGGYGMPGGHPMTYPATYGAASVTAPVVTYPAPH